MAEVTYYFNSKTTSVWTDSGYMIDGILTNYAYTSSDGDVEKLDGTNCPGTDLGVITKVEGRVYGYGDGDDRIDLGFGTIALQHEVTMPSSPGWSNYIDVTNAVGVAPWTWAKVQSLPVLYLLWVEYDKVGKGNPMYCAKVEIKVTYTPPPWVPPESDIDVGADPIDRIAALGVPYTYIGEDNPANASGTLHSVKVYAAANLIGLRIGTFYKTNGSIFKCRDSVVIGDVEAGAERTFTELSIAVQEGDYIGCYFTGGWIEWDSSGFLGVWSQMGEHIDPGDEEFYTFEAGGAISLYGYGDLGEPPAYYHGLKVQSEGELALCDVGTNPLRVRKSGVTYGLELVAVDDPNASRIRIKTPAGIKAIRKYT